MGAINAKGNCVETVQHIFIIRMAIIQENIKKSVLIKFGNPI